MPEPVRRAPPGRYGRRDAGPRLSPAAKVAAVVALAAVSALVAFVFARSTTSSFGSQRVGVESFELRDASVAITFTVRRDPDEELVCVLRSRDRAGAEIGRAEVPVPADPGGATEVTLTYELLTAGIPVSGEAIGCGEPVTP